MYFHTGKHVLFPSGTGSWSNIIPLKCVKIVIKYYLVLVIKYSTQNVVALTVNSYTDSKLFKNVNVDIKKHIKHMSWNPTKKLNLQTNHVTPNIF